MTPIERFAKGLFTANVMLSAEREGVAAPCEQRIRRAWENNPRERERWLKVATRICAEVPGLDAGALMGQREPFLLACGRKDGKQVEVYLSRVNLFLLLILTLILGWISGGMTAIAINP